MMPLFTDAIANLRGRPLPKMPTTSMYYPHITREGSIDLVDGLSATYSALYRRQPWVYAAVNKIARSVARTPIKVYDGPSDDRQRVKDGELPELLRNSFRLKERAVKSVAVYGVSIIVKMGMRDETDTPDELIPAPSTGWTIGEGDVYVWTDRAGNRYPFQRWQIIHTDFWDCDESGFGMSMLEPLRMTLAVEDAAQRFGFAAFKNGARPANILKTDKELKQETAKALAEQFRDIHGGVDNAFKLAVLSHGLDWANPPVANLDDAAVIEHRTLTRQEVAAVLDVPQPTIGILDEANFASVDMFHTMLYQDSCGAWFALLEESLQRQLVEATPAFAGLVVEFDAHGLMRGSDATQYRNYATALASGFMTPNEVRARENLPRSEQPEADMLRFPLASTSGAVGAQIAEDTGQEDDASQSALYQRNGAVHA